MSRFRLIPALQRVHLLSERTIATCGFHDCVFAQTSSGSYPTNISRGLREQGRFIHSTSVTQLIQKKKKIGFKDDDETLEEEEESDSDSDEEEDDGTRKDFKEQTVLLTNNRLDNLLKAVFGLSRANAEKKIMEGNVYINEERCIKKSNELMNGDTVDMYRQPSPDNVKLSVISRAIVARIAPEKKKGKTEMKVRIWKEMVVSDYSDSSNSTN